MVIGFSTAIAGLAVTPQFATPEAAAAATLIPYRWPFDTVILPQTIYGQQWDAPRPNGRHHAGADFNVGSVNAGTPIHSIAAGVVVRGEYSPQPSGVQTYKFGNWVTIRNDDGMYTTYAHMQGAPLVQPGERVALGQQIGKLGSTGTNVFHLHLEMRTGDDAGSFTIQDDFDPVPYINQRLSIPKPIPTIAVSAEAEEEEDMYITRAANGTVAVFGGGFRSDGGNAGRHQFGSQTEYQQWRTVLLAYNDNLDKTGQDARGKRIVPPADLRDVLGVDETNWGVICGMWGV
ncbi:M23 family metallopeptidase [Clavibacter sp. VKM Ac-2873]|uniref:M23 family metallopeptidase n=1 Tax=Clavibacter sp. VKM Ac-2873 TaxID=2783813 RepID=UPI00188A2677|nr:M23 family metallopeptidase [Clavibacter sp. VKM Ac-2873]